jgi:hypothetical protein
MSDRLAIGVGVSSSVDSGRGAEQVELGLPAAETHRWQLDDGAFIELIDLGIPSR